MTASNEGKQASATPVITQNQVLNIANIPEGTTYSITELPKPGYELVDITSNKTSTRSGAAISGEIVTNSNNEITYTNRRDKADLEIYKVKKTSLDKETKEYLEGAVFTITQLDETGSGNYKLDNSSEETPKPLACQIDITTDEHGKAVIEGLLPGYYEIKETTAPAGYILTSQPEFIKVEQGVITRIQKKDDNKSTTDIDESLVTNWPVNTDNTGLFRFTAATAAVEDDPSTDEDESRQAVNANYFVGNEPGAELPSTGGPGTQIFTIFGSILILGAGLLLWKRRQQRQS